MPKTLLAVVLICLGCAQAWLAAAPCVDAPRLRRAPVAPPLMLAKKKKGDGSSRRAKRKEAEQPAAGAVPDTPLVLAEFAEETGPGGQFAMDTAPLSATQQGELQLVDEEPKPQLEPMPQLAMSISVDDEPKLKLPSFDGYGRSGTPRELSPLTHFFTHSSPQHSSRTHKKSSPLQSHLLGQASRKRRRRNRRGSCASFLGSPRESTSTRSRPRRKRSPSSRRSSSDSHGCALPARPPRLLETARPCQTERTVEACACLHRRDWDSLSLSRSSSTRPPSNKLSPRCSAFSKATSAAGQFQFEFNYYYQL